jgi:hypothetical protein
MHIKLINGVPKVYGAAQLRRDNPRVSFPTDIPDEVMAEHGVYRVKILPRPEYNTSSELIRLTDVSYINGEWVQGWEILPNPVENWVYGMVADKT